MTNVLPRRTALSAIAALSLLPGSSRAQTAFEGLAARARAAAEDEVVVAGGTGTYGAMVKAGFFDAFTAQSGIRVTVVGGSYGEKLARLRAMSQVGRVEWDLVTLSLDSLTPDVAPMLQDLGTCAALPDVAAHGVAGACVGRGVLFDLGAGVMAYRADAMPAGRRPAGWQDFWDVRAFPGPRALPNIGTPWWPLIAALIADGVPPAALFPLDLDRAFRKMDAIRPHVSVWWKSGDQSQQAFRSREVDMGMLFAGRALRLRSEGLPIETVWAGAPLDASAWAITAKPPHPNASLALLDFVYTRPEAHAAFARESFGITAQRDALQQLPETDRPSYATFPANWDNVVRVDPAWLAANQDTVIRRWNAWISA